MGDDFGVGLIHDHGCAIIRDSEEPWWGPKQQLELEIMRGKSIAITVAHKTNLGNYQSMDVSITYEVEFEEGDNIGSCQAAASQAARDALQQTEIDFFSQLNARDGQEMPSWVQQSILGM